MSLQATMVATCRSRPAGAVDEDADWIEWRADLLGDVPPEKFKQCGAKLLYSLRSVVEGGGGPDDLLQRAARLCRAAAVFDLVELEGQRDLVPTILEQIPKHRRIISWHGCATEPVVLLRLFAEFERVKARMYRLVTGSEKVLDALAPLQFLAALRRDDVISYAESDHAAWTRPLAARLGAPVVFGEMTSGHSFSPANLSVLRRDYGLPDLYRVEELFAIVGRSVQASPSPELHNAAYRAQRAARLFLRLPIESFENFWSEVIEPGLFEELGFSLRGMTVASPHKKAALSAATEVSAISRLAESANVIYRRGLMWHADSTDADGVLMNLAAAGLSCAGRRVAVIGCGGSGRPIAVALRRGGAHVKLVNRGVARGRWAEELLGLPFLALGELRPSEFDLVVNATPLGSGDEEVPIDFEQMPHGSVVIDLVYSTNGTSFGSAARDCGHTVIDGHRILLAQVARQYRLMTGEEMPRSVAGDFQSVDADEELAHFPPDRETAAPAAICAPLST